MGGYLRFKLGERGTALDGYDARGLHIGRVINWSFSGVSSELYADLNGRTWYGAP